MTTQLLKPKKKSAGRTGNNRRIGAPHRGNMIVNGSVVIPAWVTDLDSFRRWAFSSDFPRESRFAWLAGNLWAEVHSDLLNHLSDVKAENLRTTALAMARQVPSHSRAVENGGTLIDGLIYVPRWVQDNDSFCRWALSDNFPAYGRYSFLDAHLWVDLSMETLTHNLIKGQIAAVLTLLVARELLGIYLHDGMLLVNEAANISNEPDGAFISTEAIEKGVVTLTDGKESRIIGGTPNMALEVISKSSVEKDTVLLRKLYAKAGIAEYWLVDSRVETPELVIMRLSGGKYVSVRNQGGWVKSKVFGRSFRLTCRTDSKSIPHFNLETK